MKIYKERFSGDAHTAGRCLLRKAVLENYGCDSFDITYNENGKPLSEVCYFSISHKNGIAVCAVSDREIGIDVEDIKDIKKRAEYKLFTLEESEFVNEKPDESNVRYLTIFTMKEAFVKMRGGRLFDSAKLNTVSGGSLQTDFDDFCFKTKIENGFIITVCEKKQ